MVVDISGKVTSLFEYFLSFGGFFVIFCNPWPDDFVFDNLGHLFFQFATFFIRLQTQL